jgi:hypothetical protein
MNYSVEDRCCTKRHSPLRGQRAAPNGNRAFPPCLLRFLSAITARNSSSVFFHYALVITVIGALECLLTT